MKTYGILLFPSVSRFFAYAYKNTHCNRCCNAVYDVLSLWTYRFFLIFSSLSPSFSPQPYSHGRFPITMMMKLAHHFLSFWTQRNRLHYNACFVSMHQPWCVLVLTHFLLKKTSLKMISPWEFYYSRSECYSWNISRIIYFYRYRVYCKCSTV